jgi:hypothetical protein
MPILPDEEAFPHTTTMLEVAKRLPEEQKFRCAQSLCELMEARLQIVLRELKTAAAQAGPSSPFVPTWQIKKIIQQLEAPL